MSNFGRIDGKLVLQDGSTYLGARFGAKQEITGEVVFNTGMTGYVETFTDCSYAGQILVMTYPLIGNYGVPLCEHDESAQRSAVETLMANAYESTGLQVLGVVVNEASACFSHHTAKMSLHEWFEKEGVVGLSGVDTRAITRRLREEGVMLGKIAHVDSDDTIGETSVNLDTVVEKVSCKEKTTYEAGDLSVVLVDCGAKLNIIRHLVKRGITVHRVPHDTNLLTLEEDYNGIVLSNGPGDPKNVPTLIAQVEAMLSAEKPIFGICLGNQILSLAAGADTYKLKYGHRSQNQPCQDLFSRRSAITSQNHGYAVVEDSLPAGWDTWFVNINDGTNEGVRHRTKPYYSVQFHPEAAPGPVDTQFLFDDFARVLAQYR